MEKLLNYVKIINGYPFTSQELSYEEGISVIKIKEMKNNKVVFSNDTCFALPKKQLKSYEINYNDIIVALTGNPLGKGNKDALVGRTSLYRHKKSSYLNQRICKIFPKNNDILNLYLYYFLVTNLITIAKKCTGSANQANISSNDILDLDIDLPPKSTQHHIVDTIGSVDDLIEKNEEIIEKIHKYISNYYKLVTNNVKYTNLNQLSYFNIIKSGIDKFEKEKIYIDTASVNNDKIIDTSYTILYDNKPSRANMQPIKNSVWFAKLKDSPKYILVKDTSNRILNNYIFSTGFFGLEADEYTINYLYALILDDSFVKQKDSISTGATMMGINNDLLGTIQVPNLNQKDVISFGQHIEPMIQSLLSLKEKNIILQNIKSVLLSKYFE